MKKYIAILAVVICSFHGYSQPWKSARLEVFGGFSGLQYFGDIGGTADATNLLGLKDINLGKLRPGVLVGARYHITKPFQVKASFQTGFLTQADDGSRNEGRELSFSTYISEITAVAEYYIIPESDENYYYSIMQVRGGLRHFKQPYSLYVFAGLGGIYYSVTPDELLLASPRFNGDKHITMVIPAGVGFKYAILPKICLGLELGGRYTFTDYLDGYTSPYSKHNDVYYSFALLFNYKIQKTRKANIGIRRRRLL
jgi:hypothetical protein